MHKSVFEGVLTDSELAKLKKELERIIMIEEDAICIYKIDNIYHARKEELGIIQNFSNII